MNETPVSGDRRTRRASLHQAFRAVKARQADQRTRMGRVAERLTQIASSTWFFWLHVVWFAVWIGWNAGVAIGAFDPFPFGLLTMIVSLEAIFLATFVLMTQQREAGIAELREELTLQVNLRIEEEVTKTLQLVAGLYTRLGHTMAQDTELERMLEPLDATAIEREVTSQLNEAARQHPRLARAWKRTR
jgi:uncharacterized membrane protein